MHWFASLFVFSLAVNSCFTFEGDRIGSDEQWTRIYEFNMAKGTAYYASKYVTKQFGEWELSDNIEAFRIQQPTLPLIRCNPRSSHSSR